jgi:hypothetical protein
VDAQRVREWAKTDVTCEVEVNPRIEIVGATVPSTAHRFNQLPVQNDRDVLTASMPESMGK